MFKTIEYKLIIYLILLVLSAIATTYFTVIGEYITASAILIIGLFSINRIIKHYNRYNQNILFLLNALENGDYMFYFTESNLSRRERELNNMLNRIKNLLVKAREEVIANERFLSIMVESVSTGIMIMDNKGNITMSNKSARRLIGLPVLTHINQFKLIDSSLPGIFKDLKNKDTETININSESEIQQVALKTSSIRVKDKDLRIIALNSIGNELEAKEMESWIKLIRVMTHEIMNSIAPISSLTDTLLSNYELDRLENNENPDNENDTVEALKTIGSTAKGLISFVQSYRKFTGIPTPKVGKFDLHELLTNSIKLESPMISHSNISIELNTVPATQIIEGDKDQISQVVLNLLKNAIEATDSAGNGIITINTKKIDGRTIVEICNNGKPIDNEIVPNIFIPFFTTKQDGTGIGLSISRYIMRLHGGNLKHHTKNGLTVFSMVF